ncbi:unnamed protein product [Withania somnifera]
MTALAQIPINLSPLNTSHDALYRKPKLLRRNPVLIGKNGILMKKERWGCEKRMLFVKAGAFREKDSFLTGKNGISMKKESRGCEKRMVLVRLKQGFGFDGIGGGGGGGGGRLLAVLPPILGLGAFIWWAGRDIVQGGCPNCGNDFQLFKSTLNDEVQLCAFCTQPFSVVGDKFMRDPVTFSNQSTIFGQAFSDFSTRSKKGLRRLKLQANLVDVSSHHKFLS